MNLEAERARERNGRIVAIVVAFALHVVFVLSIPAVRESIGFEIESEGLVEEPPPPPPPPAPEPEQPAVVEPTRERRPRAETPDTPPPPENTPPPPPAAPPIDFGEMALSNADPNATNTVPVAEGGDPRGVRGGQAGGVVGGSPDGVVGGTGPLTAANLSRRPRPPSGLNDAALKRNYPLGARRTGTPGRAVVRITLGPDGNIRSVATSNESPAGQGFAAACRTTVMEHAQGWQPALDAHGQPGVYTFSFPCTFEITD